MPVPPTLSSPAPGPVPDHERVVPRGPVSDASRNLLGLLEAGPKTAEELKKALGLSDKTLYKHLNLLLDLHRVQVLPFRQERGWGSLFFLSRDLERATRMTGYAPAEGVSTLLVPPGEFPADPEERVRRWLHWQYVQTERLIDHALRSMRGVSPLILRLLRWRSIYQRAARQTELLMELARHPGATEIPEPLARRLLQHEMTYSRADRRHPDFPRLEAAIRQRHRNTLTLLTKMMNASGSDYASWIRSALPERGEMAEIVGRMRGDFQLLTEMIQKGVVRVPRFLREPFLGLIRFLHTGYFQIFEEELDVLYRKP